MGDCSYRSLNQAAQVLQRQKRVPEFLPLSQFISVIMRALALRIGWAKLVEPGTFQILLSESRKEVHADFAVLASFSS